MADSEEEKELALRKNSMHSKCKTIIPVSIIIPAYCEQEWLPILLKSIKQQTLQPLEIIVADAQSTDNTRAIAKQYKVKIIEGGKIAFARNAGAKIAKGEYILFMDADTELSNKYVLSEALKKFKARKLDIASARFITSAKREDRFIGILAGKIIWGIVNIWRFVQQKFQKVYFEGGAFILIKESVFNALNGFDEKLLINEDPDLFKRAVAAHYKYGHLSVNVITSSRRFNTLKKIVKVTQFFILNTYLLFTGASASSDKVKKNWKNYGALGGGKGKKTEEE